jgi:GMP synthase PP-ATPase subunit
MSNGLEEHRTTRTVKGIDRTCYDVTSKPPGTIDRE